MPRYVFALLCSLFLLPIAHADDKERKPNTLTPQEAAEGWILLFDGETTFGWVAEGNLKVQNGELHLGDDKEAVARTKTMFSNGEVRFELHQQDPQVGVDFLLNGAPYNGFKEAIRQFKSPGAGFQEYELTLVGNTVSAIKVIGQGGVGNTIPETPSACDLGFKTTPGNAIRLRNLRFKPSGTTSLFAGKDLTGWKEVKTAQTKSVFSVTEKGELNIKNGPGDIQTEGEWDDFVLQLDCISNGTRLNSGVFFRCVPEKFWSGYEAQVRNDFLSEVKLKDGATHVGHLSQKEDVFTLRLFEKQGNRYVPMREAPEPGKRPRDKAPLKFTKADVESVKDLRDQPFDYGTGGLYNRQPARKVVSSDGEYFTMTVIAHGAHIAIWVNGYQTVDFTDTAKDAPSARQGRKLGKGPISLQGHDPTTDLSFKNIRLAPLAPLNRAP